MANPQLCGILQKPPFGHQSNKLSKRFFVVLDGYMLYYPETEKKEFEKRNYISIHPKGVIPLGGCDIQPISIAAYPFCIRIKNDETTNQFVVAAESEFERDKWIAALAESSRITWRNAQIGNAMINQLEKDGLQTALEKQNYIDKLKSEAEASQSHKQRAEELKQMNEELEKEKSKAEAMVRAMQQEYELVKEELGRTADALETLEDERENLQSSAMILKQNLQALEDEKIKIEQAFQNERRSKEGLHRQNSDLAQNSENMTQKLLKINEAMEAIRTEKLSAERRLRDHEDASQTLREEKETFCEHASRLAASLKELSSQKENTEAELRVEVAARLEAEKRLKEAERSLKELEEKINRSRQDSEESKMAMIFNVKYLQKFFENLAFESRIDAEKTRMIKSSMQARRAALDRRARTIGGKASGKSRAGGKLRKPINIEMLKEPDVSSRDPSSNQSNDTDILSSLPEDTVISPLHRTGPRLVLHNPGTRHSVNICMNGMNTT